MKSFAHSLRAALLAATAFVSVTASFAADGPAATPAAATAAKPAKPDLAKGEAIFNATPANSQSCASCHNADGNSSIAANPKLAQQHPEYILKQLQEFKSGKRKSPIMKPLAAALSDEDMRNIAWFVGSKKGKTGFAKDKELVALGEKIYRGGIADRQVPACAGCHSPNGSGMPAQYPRLSGQHADYTTAQMVAFRDGQRLNNPVMNGVAAKLNDREIKAVADYVAGLR
ncbi:MAG TPA: c-type cytochrome [Variovorax sp.]|nr:c-type cytochrome [Variovorax sp.]